MKSAFRAIAVRNAVATALCILLVLPAGAQISGSQSGGSSNNDAGLMVVPYRTYAEYALDLILNQMAGRGLDVAINSDEYIVGPGDEFRISFVSGDINNIVGRVGTGGELFMKSVGSVEITGISLRQATQTIEHAVKKSFSGADFNIQLADFRFIRVNVIGEVAQPGLYYVPAIWRVSEVIELSGGLTPNAALRRIVLRGHESESAVDLLRFKTVGDTRVNPFIASGHTIVVPDRNSSEKYVSVSGQVVRPGIFAAVEGDHLSDYLIYASGPRGNLTDMVIQLSSQNGEVIEQLDGADPKTLEYLPAPGDNLALVRKDGRKDWGTVTVTGEVVRPGKYPIGSGDFSLRDLLNLCGDITPDGCSEMIRIYRRTNDPFAPNTYPVAEADLPAMDSESFGNLGRYNNQRGLVSYNPRQPLDPAQIILADDDSLHIPRATGMVSVTGAVVSPGLVRYREGKDVDYYLEQAGGLGFNADQERMVVVNPVTGGGISADKAGELFDGEMLFVPRKESGTKP